MENSTDIGKDTADELGSGAALDLRARVTSKKEAGGTPGFTPDEAIEWMNRKHFVTREGGKVVVLTEEIDPELERRVLRRSSFEDIRQFYCNQFVWTPDAKGELKPTRLGHYWLSHRHRRSYEGVAFTPKGNVPGYYNLWRGFSVKPQEGNWSLMRAHIEQIICAGNAELYEYVRGWMAFAVQQPNALPEVALVLRGRQGTGKGIFVRWFGKLFGQHFLHLARSRQLTGHFNAHLRDAILVFADEAFLVGDKDAEGTLKGLITEPYLQIERKFQDQVTCRNSVHLIVASNNDRIVNAAPEERRFCMLDVSDAKMQNHAYFTAIEKQMTNGGLQAMLYDLQQENLEQFEPRRFPATDALDDQKIQSMRPEELWWFKTLQEGRCSAEDDSWPFEAVRESMLDEFREGTGEPSLNVQDLRTALEKLLPAGYPKNGARRLVEGKRKRTWILPPLADCRTHFATKLRLRKCWPEPEEATEVEVRPVILASVDLQG